MYLKPSRRKRAKTRLIIITAAAATAAGVLVLLWYLGLLPVHMFTRGTVKQLEYTLPDNVIANENGLLYSQNNMLFYADSSGGVIWEQTLDLQDVTTVASDNLICNYAGKSLQVMKYDKSQLFSTTTDSEILDAAVGNETLAVLTNEMTEQLTKRSYVSLYSTGGERTGQQIDFGTRQVLSFGFHGKNDMFWALALDTSGVAPISVISTYKSDGSMTNNIQVNTQIVESVYLTDTAIYASGTNSLTSYTYFSEKQAEQPIYGWRENAASVTQQSVTIAYAPRSAVREIDVARVYKGDLSYIQVRLPQGVLQLAVTPTRLYAFASDVVYVYGQDGSPEKEIKLEQEITRARQVSANEVVLWGAQRSFLMELA